MQETVGIFILGTAGCGKSTLAAAAAHWLQEGGYPVQLVNLDPGSDITPYEADIDVRDWLTLGDIMEEYELGPNGAQVVASDMVAIYKNRIKEGIDYTSGGYVIFDTPGQLELFTFREATRDLVTSLVPHSYLLYLVDPFNARTPSGFISQMMLSSLARLRFQVPSMDVLSKADMIEAEQMEKIERWQNFPEQLTNDMLEEAKTAPSMSSELGLSLNRVLEESGIAPKMFPVSSKTGLGMESIYEIIQLTYGGGDDLAVPNDED